MAIFMESLRKHLAMSRSSLEGDRIRSSMLDLLGDQGVQGGDRWLGGEIASRLGVRPWSML